MLMLMLLPTDLLWWQVFWKKQMSEHLRESLSHALTVRAISRDVPFLFRLLFWVQTHHSFSISFIFTVFIVLSYIFCFENVQCLVNLVVPSFLRNLNPFLVTVLKKRAAHTSVAGAVRFRRGKIRSKFVQIKNAYSHQHRKSLLMEMIFADGKWNFPCLTNVVRL